MYINIRTGNTLASLEVDIEQGMRMIDIITKDFLPVINIDEYELSSKRKFDTVGSTTELLKVLVGLYSQGTAFDVKDTGISVEKEKKLTEEKIKLSEIYDSSSIYLKYINSCIEADIDGKARVFRNIHAMFNEIFVKSGELLVKLKIDKTTISSYRVTYTAKISSEFQGIKAIDLADTVAVNVIIGKLFERLTNTLNMFGDCTRALGIFDSNIGDLIKRGIDLNGVINC